VTLTLLVELLFIRVLYEVTTLGLTCAWYVGGVSVHPGSSPYKCDQCSYTSADRSTLNRHLRTHNGERPFQCLICEFAFTTKANCERHVRYVSF